MKPTDLLRATPKGLYCPPGDFFIDPAVPVGRALITHGHSDHARPGHAAVLATQQTLDIMAIRQGGSAAPETEAAPYGKPLTVNGVSIKFEPAGHVLGSAQIVVEHGGVRIAVSGDYKRRRDPTCASFEPQPCDVFITEATFGLPVFIHPPDAGEIARLLSSLAQFPERAHMVGAYALGKAQRVIMLLREAGWERTIYLHGALERLCSYYASQGLDLGPLAPATERSGLAGEIVLGPPSAIADRWARRFDNPLSCFASGWMRVRQRAKQPGVELPLILSDHADWTELTDTIRDTGASEIWITHGREEALMRWCALNGIASRPLSLTGFDDEAE